VTFVSPNGAAQVTVDVEVTDTRDFDFSADATVTYEKDANVKEAQFFEDAHVSANKPYIATSN